MSSPPAAEQFAIRRSLPEDAGAIRTMIQVRLSSANAAHLPQELADFERMPDGPEIGAAQLAADLSAGAAHSFLLVETRSEEPAGFAIYYHAYAARQGRFIHLEDLYVRERFRRRGLAQRMLRHLAAAALAEGVRRIDWDVLDWNAPARELYEKMGAADCYAKEGLVSYRLEEAAIRALAGGH